MTLSGRLNHKLIVQRKESNERRKVTDAQSTYTLNHRQERFI